MKKEKVYLVIGNHKSDKNYVYGFEVISQNISTVKTYLREKGFTHYCILTDKKKDLLLYLASKSNLTELENEITKLTSNHNYWDKIENYLIDYAKDVYKYD